MPEFRINVEFRMSELEMNAEFRMLEFRMKEETPREFLIFLYNQQKSPRDFIHNSTF